MKRERSRWVGKRRRGRVRTKKRRRDERAEVFREIREAIADEDVARLHRIVVEGEEELGS